MSVSNANRTSRGKGRKAGEPATIEGVEEVVARHAGAEDEARLSRSRAARFFSELFGSFILFLGVYAVLTYGVAVNALMIGVNATAVGLAVGLVYAAVSCVFGRTSGADLNPAVSLANVILGRIDVWDFIAYVVAQCAGAFGAAEIIVHVLPVDSSVTSVTLYGTWVHWAVNGYDSASPLANSLNQMTGSSNLTFGIALALVVETLMSLVVVAVAVRSRNEHGAPRRGAWLATGVAYAAGTVVAYPVTGAALNPARATGMAIAARQTVTDYNNSLESTTTSTTLVPMPTSQLWVFWVAPLLAAAVVAIVLIVIRLQHSDTPSRVDEIERKAEVLATAADAAGEAVAADDAESVAESTAEALAKAGVSFALEDDEEEKKESEEKEEKEEGEDAEGGDAPEPSDGDAEEGRGLPEVRDSAGLHDAKDEKEGE